MPDGQLQSTECSAATLNDAADHEPDGVYTVSRTFRRTQALLLDAHLDRIEESARLEKIPLQLDRHALRSALYTLIEQSGFSDSRFRITIPRDNPRQIYFALEFLSPIPDSVRKGGVKVASIRARRNNPVAKITAWMRQRKVVTGDLPADIYQAMLVN
ncbi:MAG TPA: aminotransferase class IV, partial [Aggregatilineales bacterium]|nr:aminotransferase class IV [Aggregatilineales bacterium]